jgi:hypothetical protein
MEDEQTAAAAAAADGGAAEALSELAEAERQLQDLAAEEARIQVCTAADVTESYQVHCLYYWDARAGPPQPYLA